MNSSDGVVEALLVVGGLSVLVALVLLVVAWSVRRRARPAESAEEPKPRGWARGAVVGGVIGVAIVLLRAGGGGVPGCEDPVVQAMAAQIIDRDFPAAEARLSSFGEVEGETTEARRVCRAKATTFEGSEFWLSLSVERHGDDDIFVQFID